jgi:BioD-like phosphotransacetylase family protein
MMSGESVSMGTKYLLVASTEACSGKSATIVGIADRLQMKGIQIAYAKPLVTAEFIPGGKERLTLSIDDAQMMAQVLSLPPSNIVGQICTIDEESIAKRLTGKDDRDYLELLTSSLQSLNTDLAILEGAGDLQEGNLFNLATEQVAQALDAGILLVSRYHPLASSDVILAAQRQLGTRLLGVIINDIPHDRLETVQNTLVPYLERSGIPVFAAIPRNGLLRSVTVRQLVQQLNAEVLCRPDRLSLMVESLSIGAMNVNSALEYFRKGTNMAVVTGGDRADIQLAALETSTQCLILTGHLPPQPFIVSRAEDLEIPILSVDLDTLTTVEIIDRTFGQVHLQEPIKVNCVRELFANHCDVERLISSLGID